MHTERRSRPSIKQNIYLSNESNRPINAYRKKPRKQSQTERIEINYLKHAL